MNNSEYWFRGALFQNTIPASEENQILLHIKPINRASLFKQDSVNLYIQDALFESQKGHFGYARHCSFSAGRFRDGNLTSKKNTFQIFYSLFSTIMQPRNISVWITSFLVE
jgi:hypothetical protein